MSGNSVGMKKKKLLSKLLSGSRNIEFSEVTSIAEAVGFQLERINGSHPIFSHPDIPEILNVQKVCGQAKPYQIRQLVKLIEKHNFTLHEADEGLSHQPVP